MVNWYCWLEVTRVDVAEPCDGLADLRMNVTGLAERKNCVPAMFVIIAFLISGRKKYRWTHMRKKGNQQSTKTPMMMASVLAAFFSLETEIFSFRLNRLPTLVRTLTPRIRMTPGMGHLLM